MSGIRPHVIIGANAAGLSAVKAVRRSGDRRPIVLISAEKEGSYSPVLTTYYIGGQIPRKKLLLAGGDFFRKNGVRTIFGRRVEGVEPDRGRIVFNARNHLDYKTLLLATGASARGLDNVDPDAAGFVSSLRTIADAERIRSLAQKAREVVVTGAGLVSLQTIKAIMREGLKITAVVGSDRILSQQMDRETAYLVQRRIEARGVEILFGRRIERVERRGDRVAVVTGYGEALPADLVVVGKGVEPNKGLAREAGLETDYGILVDEFLQTTRPGIFAAGDAAEARNMITGQREVVATWFNASAQGEIAGYNLAGRRVRQEGALRENVTTLFGLVVTALGQSNPGYGLYEEFRRVDYRNAQARKFFFDGPRLVGALLVGRRSDAGVIRHCIANRVDLSAFKGDLTRAPLDFGKLLGGHDLDWPHPSQ